MTEVKSQQKPFKAYEKQLRWLTLLYIILLVFEGALRKWFLPSLSNVLILARDPIVLIAYFIALANGVFPKNKYVISGFIIVGLSFVVTMLFGHGNPVVAVYGFRANLLHLPFAFLIGSVLYRDDVILIGKYWLWCTAGMTALIVFQFYSPQSAWVNVGPGGTGSAGFGGAMGRYRPPGTFTFIIGVVWFYTFAAAFLLANVTQHNKYSKLLTVLSAFAIILALPVSISRMLILSVALTCFVSLGVSALQKNALARYGRTAICIVVAVMIAAQIPVFSDAKEAFLSRWSDSTSEDMGGVKDAIFMRVVGEFIGPFLPGEDIPLFGMGLGAGTQIGAQLLIGERRFHLGESEWFRLTGESGILLGTPYILWRVLIFVALLRLCLRARAATGNGMGLILLSAFGYNLLVGPFGQGTVLGFTVIGIGLAAASLKTRDTISSVEPTQ